MSVPPNENANLPAVFAALADPTRLMLIDRLGNGESCSIAALSRNGTITRQAVTKHLTVLEQAGLVMRERMGRESRYRLHPAPLTDARAYLESIALQWEDALQRLKRFVED